jgi:hypothetical protein
MLMIFDVDVDTLYFCLVVDLWMKEEQYQQEVCKDLFCERRLFRSKMILRLTSRKLLQFQCARWPTYRHMAHGVDIIGGKQLLTTRKYNEEENEVSHAATCDLLYHAILLTSTVAMTVVAILNPAEISVILAVYTYINHSHS